jgi:hypothetical protein
VLPHEGERDRIIARLEASGRRADADGIVRDPSGNGLRLTVA